MRTIRILLTIFLLAPLPVFAQHVQITIVGERLDQLHVDTDAYTVLFDRGTIAQLHNKRTGETHTLPRAANPNPGIEQLQINKIDPHRADIVFKGGGNTMTLSIAVDPANHDLLIAGQRDSAQPGVRGIQWCIENLDIHNLSLIIPSQGIQQIDASSAIEHRNFPYPNTFHWEAQLAIIESQLGGFYVRGTDPTFKFKELNYERDAAHFGLVFKTINQAPWDSLTSAKSVTWRLNTYVGEWCVPAHIHRDWMEQAFNPWRLSDVPAWVSDIGLVVFLTKLDTEQLNAVEALAQHVEPTQTLFYLTDWRKYENDIMHPDFTAIHHNFETFLEVARRYGYRIMLHVNLHNCSPTHPLYAEFKQYQIRHPNGELSGWRWDDIDHPDRNAHISLGSSRWRNLLIRQFKALRDKYAIDAFHLDVSHYIANDGNGLVEGLTSAEASVLMHRQLMEAMPGVVLAGEHLHEVTFFRESIAQRNLSEHATHPLSAFLFAPYTRFMGHLGFPREHNPQRLRYAIQFYERQGTLPTARIWNESLLHQPITRDILAVARQWQALKLTPDIHCHWCENTLFQYTTDNGESVTYQKVDGVYSLNIPGGNGYRRVHGVTQAATRWNLPEWRAYNEEMLLGLDPNKYYSLRNAPRDVSQLHINALSPGVYLTHTSVTPQAALFRLASTSSIGKTSVGMFLPTPAMTSVPDTLRPIGDGHYTLKTNLSQPVVIILSAPPIRLPHNLRDAQYTAGLQQHGIFQIGSWYGSGDRTNATIDGVHKETIFAHPPPYDAETILQFTFALADAPSTLSYSLGLDGEHSQGVLFEIRINGQTRVDILKDTFDWTDGSLSLSEFAGQPVLLEFVTDPGQYGGGGANYDWAHWGDLIITADTNPADVNGDGIVNILDLTLVAQALGTASRESDVNGDGVVNVFDLVFVAGQF